MYDMYAQLNMAIKFEWDDNKNQVNIEKHGISFDDAVSVFDNPFFERIDDRIDYGEIRHILLGRLDNNTVVVVYTKRNRSIRLISARQANKNERETYQTFIQNRLDPFESDG